MKSPFYHRFVFLLCACLQLFWISAGSAQVSVQSSLGTNQIGLDDRANLTIQVRGVTQMPAQPEVVVPGMEVQPIGVSSSQTIINGVVQATIAFNYMLSTDKTGDYVIPEIELMVEGTNYKTKPLNLKVVEGAPTPTGFDPILKLEASKSEVYEGEVFPITITLMVHQNTNIMELPFPGLPRENFAMKRFQRTPDQTMQEYNGALYRVFKYGTTMNALKSGDLTMGPADAKVELLVPDGSGRRDPFGGVSGRQKTYKIKSDPITLHVKPLPTEGKPADFSGAIGTFNVQLQAQPLKVVEGDPIAATIYVSGMGNFESLVCPEMEGKDGWRLYPSKLVQENRNSGLEAGSVAYSQVLIPESIKKEIPPFALTYFNPETSKYGIVKTEAIPIQVTPNPAKAAPGADAAAPSSGIKDFSFTDKNAPGEDMQGTLTIVNDMGTPVSLTTVAAASSNQPWIIHAIGGAILLGLLGKALSRKLKETKSTKAAKVAAPPKSSDILRQVKSEQSSPRNFYALAADYLAAWQRETSKPLPDVPILKQIQLRRDFYNYGSPAEANQAVPASEHQEVLEALKKL